MKSETTTTKTAAEKTAARKAAAAKAAETRKRKAAEKAAAEAAEKAAAKTPAENRIAAAKVASAALAGSAAKTDAPAPAKTADAPAVAYRPTIRNRVLLAVADAGPEGISFRPGLTTALGVRDIAFDILNRPEIRKFRREGETRLYYALTDEGKTAAAALRAAKTSAEKAAK